MKAAILRRYAMMFTVVLAAFAVAGVRGQEYERVSSLPAETYPRGSLVEGPDGSMYGAMTHGGANKVGSLYQITTNGIITELAFFNKLSGQTYHPRDIVFGNDGHLYGVASGISQVGTGAVFRADLSGNVTTLATFHGTNGAFPTRIIQASDGHLYGTTLIHGGESGKGILFKLTTGGAFTSLVSFDGTNGATPDGPFFEGRDGFLYGTTRSGGENNSGTIFRASLTGELTTLFSFGEESGKYPTALVEGRDGNLYGATDGVTNGSLFKLSGAGVFTTLYTFTGGLDGRNPMGNLIHTRDGNLYGSANGGGKHNQGVIFKISTNGNFQVLHSFDSVLTGTRSYAGFRPFFLEHSGGAIFCVEAPDTSGSAFFSRTEIIPAIRSSVQAGNVTLQWPKWADNFLLEQSSDFLSWSPSPQAVSSNNSSFSVQVPANASNAFYRLKAQ